MIHHCNNDYLVNNGSFLCNNCARRKSMLQQIKLVLKVDKLIFIRKQLLVFDDLEINEELAEGQQIDDNLVKNIRND